jgi:ATP-dependent Clp protease ATP-binding subunit ClpA
MRAGNVDPEKLNRDLAAYVESEAENPVSDGNHDSKPTADFHRVIQRAAYMSDLLVGTRSLGPMC